MSKISLETLSEVLQEEGVEQPKQLKIIEHLKEILEEEKKDREESKTPKQKNEFGVVLFAPELVGKEYTACIYQLKAGDDHSTVLNRISEASRTQNETSKKKKTKIDSIGVAFEYLKRKFIKEKGVNFKTKTPIQVLISDNSLV